MAKDSKILNDSGAADKKLSVLRLLLKYGVPLAVTIGLCWLLFTGVDFNEMVAIIQRDCNFLWIAFGLALSVLSHVIRAARWRIQLAALEVKPPMWILVFTIFGTYAVNLVLPRLGELWRSGYIAQRESRPFATVFGSMICDRLSDTIMVLLLVLVTFGVASPQIMSYLQQNPALYAKVAGIVTSPWLWIGIVSVVIGVWTIMSRCPDSRIVVTVKNLCAGIWEGFAVVSKMKGKALWSLLTLMLWGCYFLQLYVAFFAFLATGEVVSRYGIVAVLVCFVLSSLSMGVPSNGGIGPYQWAIMFGLSMYAAGIPELSREYAASFANLVMGCQTLLLILLGIITFIVLSIDRKHVKIHNIDES